MATGNLKSINNDLKNDRYTYEELLVYYLKRIEKYDVNIQNSILELNSDALHLASNCVYDDNNSSLYGMPILIKGNIGTNNMHTTVGAMVLKDFICNDDSEIIKYLKSKGAIIFAKSNLSEWANFMSTQSSNGYSALGGQTKNPYGKFDVGGSSSGSASAVANNFSVLSLGTETAGSIIYPSSQNSVVGLKPTIGLLPITRIIPISKTHDTAGPITRTVMDAAHLFNSLLVDENIRKKDIKFSKDFLKNKRIGIISNEQVTGYYRKTDNSIIDRVKSELMSIGSFIEEVNILDSAFDIRSFEILKYEFREGINEFLKYSNDEIDLYSLKDIISYNELDIKNRAPYNQELIVQSFEEEIKDDEINKRIIENKEITRKALNEILMNYDVIITLSNYMTSIYAPAGYPAINVPAGYREDGEPIGLTFIAKEMEDFHVLECAYSYEQNTNHRKKP